MPRVIHRTATRALSCRAGKGQSLTELALITPVILIILLGIVEMAGAFSAKMNLQAALAQGARIGAIEGAGSDCNANPNALTVDGDIIKSILGSGGINQNYVQQIQIYRSAPDGTIDSGLYNAYAPPFIVGGIPVANPHNWYPCVRKQTEPSDSIGIHVTYAYHPVIALPQFPSLTLDDRTVQRLSPLQNSIPCPIPGIPNNVAADDISQKESLSPSNQDVISWDPIPGADTYNVYANVDNGGWNLITPDSPPAADGTGRIKAVYTNTSNTNYDPTSYEITGKNYCGEGERSLATSDQQCQRVKPLFSKTVPSAATPGDDDIEWGPVPDAASYDVTQTPSDGSPSVVKNVPAPSISGSPTIPPPVTTLMPHPGIQMDTYTVVANTRCHTVGRVSDPANVTPPTATGGTIASSESLTSSSTDLGSAPDWAHWGSAASPNYDHSSGTRITYSVVGTGSFPYSDTTHNPGYTWPSNGSPVYSELGIRGVGNGFQIRAPADTTTRTLRLYVGAYYAQGQLTASLSDNSAPIYTDTSIDTAFGNSGGFRNGVYTLTYKAGSADQVLTINFTLTSDHGNGAVGNGAVGLQAATLTPGTPPPPTLLTDHLVGYWKFDEGTGGSGSTTADSSPSQGHTGTLHSATPPPSWWTSGPSAPFNNAINLNGSNAYVSALVSGSATDLPAANAAQTITWWAKTTTSSMPTSNQTMVSLSKSSSSSAVRPGFISGSGEQQVAVRNYGGTSLVSWTPPSPSSFATTWHYYAYTFDGTTHSLYIDGLLKAYSGGSSQPNTAPTTLEFGRFGAGEYFAGSLDDVRIYARVLSPDEIAILANQP